MPYKPDDVFSDRLDVGRLRWEVAAWLGDEWDTPEIKELVPAMLALQFAMQGVYERRAR